MRPGDWSGSIGRHWQNVANPLGRLTNHHLFHPRADYTSPLEKEFRELPENQVQIAEEIHRCIHRHQSPPAKPSRVFMYDCLLKTKGFTYCKQFQGEIFTTPVS